MEGSDLKIYRSNQRIQGLKLRGCIEINIWGWLITERRRLISVLCRLVSKNGDSVNELYHCFNLPDREHNRYIFIYFTMTCTTEIDVLKWTVRYCSSLAAHLLTPTRLFKYEIQQQSDLRNAAENKTEKYISDDVGHCRHTYMQIR
ncbi:hypothetical protein AtNW77_Chr5g0116781 [Arabidopsis thaliana]